MNDRETRLVDHAIDRGLAINWTTELRRKVYVIQKMDSPQNDIMFTAQGIREAEIFLEGYWRGTQIWDS